MTFRLVTTTKLLVLASIIGLLMAVSATSHGQAIDASPPELTEDPADGPAIELPRDKAGATEAAKAEATDEPGAAQANPAQDDPIGSGGQLIQALKDGKWLVAFGFALLFLVFILRWGLAAMQIEWAETKPGGFMLAFGTSLALTLGIAFSSGAGFSVGLAVAAAGAAWAAAGLHGHIKDVFDWMRGKN